MIVNYSWKHLQSNGVNKYLGSYICSVNGRSQAEVLYLVYHILSRQRCKVFHKHILLGLYEKLNTIQSKFSGDI